MIFLKFETRKMKNEKEILSFMHAKLYLLV